MDGFFIGVAAAVFGFLTGLLVPWVKWQVERRRDRQNYRRDLIRSWREAIESHQDFDDYRYQFGDTDVYSSLRRHMKDEIVKQFEDARTFHVPGGRGGSVKKQFLLDEVTRLEMKWGLV